MARPLAKKEAFDPFISLPSLGDAVMPGRRALGYYGRTRE